MTVPGKGAPIAGQDYCFGGETGEYAGSDYSNDLDLGQKLVVEDGSGLAAENDPTR